MEYIPFLSGFGTHGYILYVPEDDEQEEAKKNTDDYFQLYGEFEGKVGRTYGGHNITSYQMSSKFFKKLIFF